MVALRGLLLLIGGRVASEEAVAELWKLGHDSSDWERLHAPAALARADHCAAADEQGGKKPGASEGDAAPLVVARFGEPTLVRTMQHAVRYGQRVLLEDIGEAIDASVLAAVTKDYFQSSNGTNCVRLGRKGLPGAAGDYCEVEVSVVIVVGPG